MPLNTGNLKEEEMINALNNKKVCELSNNMRNFIRCLFGVLDEDKVISCYKVDDSNKTDFVVEYDYRMHNVSMKSGKATVVHNEILQNFINFLKEQGISQRTLDTICLFHFGDGTTDGSNKEARKNYFNVYVSLEERIKEANEELNENMDFVLKVVNRCVFLGACEDNIEADCIYFGDVDYGVVATKNQFIKNTKRRCFDFYDNLHIGPMLLRPDARYVEKDIASERKRNRIVCYIPNLREDIEYMAKRFNY